jgi:hypothetical protein
MAAKPTPKGKPPYPVKGTNPFPPKGGGKGKGK